MTSTGVDLTSWPREHGPLSINQVVLFATGLADQLSAAHVAGMVYGSLTPTTIRVEPADARLRPAPVDRPRYQQITGPTPADDVYALGMVVRTLLDAAAVGRDGVAAPPALSALANQCVAADPGDRPTAEAVARQLRSIGRDLLLGPPAAPVKPAGEAPPTCRRPRTPAGRRHRHDDAIPVGGSSSWSPGWPSCWP